MKLSVNYKLIERNKKIAQITLYVSLAILGIGLFWTIRNPEPANTTIGYLILIPAYLLVQISISLANRWGKSPRPDEIITSSLKGLDNKYTLYNFTTNIPHLLVGPIGAWVINPYHQKGEISYDSEKGQYKQKGGSNFIAKYFAQDGIPNISRESASLKRDINKYFNENSISENVEPKVVNLFYSGEVSLETNNAPEICLKADKIKDFIRSYKKKNSISLETIDNIRSKLPKAD